MKSTLRNAGKCVSANDFGVAFDWLIMSRELCYKIKHQMKNNVKTKQVWINTNTSVLKNFSKVT